MKGLGRKASFLAIMAVIATAMMGAGYTLWYEDLELKANVSTGELDGKIYCGSTGDNDDTPPDNDEITGYPYPGKDVGDIVAKGNEDPPGDDSNTDHYYVISVGNAYPGYAFDCEVHLEAKGTVPWHVETFSIVVEAPDGSTTEVNCVNQLPGTNCIFGVPDWDNPNVPPIYVKMENMVGCQVHPGPEFDISGSLIVGVNQAALEGETYKIWLKYRVNQWNESAWDGCRDPKIT